MKRIIAPVFIAFLLVSPVAAQSTAPCPVNRVCVEYTNASGSISPLVINPAEGVYQEVVVEEWTTAIRTLDGERTTKDRVKLASYLDGGGGYSLLRERVVPVEGIYADAELGDSYGIAELH